jgi:FlaA1/EpsC-like NDP-sugar epimerase
MGASKRLGEIYVQSLGLAIESGKETGSTTFITTRFGNVLGSQGSVIPLFKMQIETGGPVTVTHPEITRYFMTIPEACKLVVEAATIGHNSEIVVFDMGKSVRIADLASRMIELSGYVPGKDIQIVYTGLRPGEKLYEEVLNSEEDTLPTSFDKIRVAKVRQYSYQDIKPVIKKITSSALEGDEMQTITLLKKIIPEFHSENSRFQILDQVCVEN